jgi:hypothetical protein
MTSSFVVPLAGVWNSYSNGEEEMLATVIGIVLVWPRGVLHHMLMAGCCAGGVHERRILSSK